MTVTLHNVRALLADEQNPLILLSPVWGQKVKYIRILFWRFVKPERKYWIVQKDLTVQLSDGRLVTIPKGFKTDVRTAPRLLQGFVAPVNDSALGYIIHDYLYIHKQSTREFADREMLIWCMVINDNVEDTWISYKTVKRFGQKWWDGKGEFIK